MAHVLMAGGLASAHKACERHYGKRLTREEVRAEVLNIARRKEAGTMDDLYEHLCASIETACACTIEELASVAFQVW